MTSFSLDKDNIDQLIEDILHGQNPRPPVDIEAIARRSGADVVYEPMLYDGSLEQRGQNQYTIKVNAKISRTRQRFTIAHEIGHIFLSLSNMTSIDTQMQESFSEELFANHNSSEERICNHIAASLLVPTKVVMQLIDWEKFRIKNIESASNRWQVSMTVMLWRVLSSSDQEAGFIWFRNMGKPNDLKDIDLRIDWGAFPKSQRMYIPKYDSVPKNSPIRRASEHELFYSNIKLDFGSLRGYRPIRVKAFGKIRNKRVLAIVYPGEFRSAHLRIQTQL